jgi:hypothetical protein
MNVEIGAQAALFPEKEYINGIFVAVHAFLVNGARVSFVEHKLYSVKRQWWEV